MMWAFKSFAKMLTGGVLDRVLSTVDKKIDAETDRSALKADIIKTHYETRVGFMRAGGFVLMLLFAVPLAAWFSSVVLYSIFWCSGCAYPQTWSIAALPPPLDAWAGGIVLAIFGVIGVQTAKK
jgi:hypothetical protein